MKVEREGVFIFLTSEIQKVWSFFLFSKLYISLSQQVQFTNPAESLFH